MEIVYIVIGLIMIYSIIHFFILQNKSYTERTGYQKVVSWVAMVSIFFVLMGVMFGE